MWMKIDDGLHAHRKTRTLTKSHPSKHRDVAPMGLWVLVFVKGDAKRAAQRLEDAELGAA